MFTMPGLPGLDLSSLTSAISGPEMPMSSANIGGSTISVGGQGPDKPDGQILSLGTGNSLGNQILIGVIIAVIAGSIVSVVKN